jgi:hypothetical protein
VSAGGFPYNRTLGDSWFAQSEVAGTVGKVRKKDAQHKRAGRMALEGSDHDGRQDEGPAAEQDAGPVSFALHALSELHGWGTESLPPVRAVQHAEKVPLASEAGETHDLVAARSADRPQLLETVGEGEGEQSARSDSLQSALDWYKDWLSSI